MTATDFVQLTAPNGDKVFLNIACITRVRKAPAEVALSHCRIDILGGQQDCRETVEEVVLLAAGQAT